MAIGAAIATCVALGLGEDAIAYDPTPTAWRLLAPLQSAMNVDLSVAIPVSGLQLLSYFRSSDYEWAEAGMLARYWLCLALLHAAGYQGQAAAIMQARPRMTSQVHPVPWVPQASASTTTP